MNIIRPQDILKMWLPNEEHNNSDEDSLKSFIDFNKTEKKLYDNLYLDEYKIVIKIPIGKKDKFLSKIKIEHFSLTNDIFLTPY